MFIPGHFKSCITGLPSLKDIQATCNIRVLYHIFSSFLVTKSYTYAEVGELVAILKDSLLCAP